jgi:hypothetical protein
MANFLYPWARESYLNQSNSLIWNGQSFHIMFLNGGITTQYTWSSTGATGYAWNPANDATLTPAGAGYAVTYMSQIPASHRSYEPTTPAAGYAAAIANTFGLHAASYGNGVAGYNASFATTTAYQVPSGAVVSAFVIYKKVSTEANSLLIAFFDTATAMPVTGNGGDITIIWDTGSNKIFKL